MAKTNIVFNNTSYSIEEASLSAATADLRAHLSNTMSGSGAVIDFGGTSYNVDSAKLTAATNEFVSHLGTIAGSGHKVMVNGVEYGIDSAKVAGVISGIEAVLGGLNSGDEELAAGLYKNGVMTKSWDELVGEGIITVEGSTITGRTDKTIAGDLIAPNSITSIGNWAFQNCAALTSVDLPAVTSIGESAFSHCDLLPYVNLPNATTIAGNAFYYDVSLTTVDLGSATTIGNSAFMQCKNLSAVILRTTSNVCAVDLTAVSGTKIIDSDGMPTGEGFLYIPTSMYEYYRAAYEPVFEQLGAAGLFDILFRKIEDYPEICNPDSGDTPSDEILEGDGQVAL